MNKAYQDAIREAFTCAPSHVVIYHTLEIRQDGVQDTILMVQARKGITAFDENGDSRYFNPIGFQFIPPSSNDEGYASLNIAIDNIDRRVTDFVNAAQSRAIPILVIYRPYVSTDLSRPQMIPPYTMYLKEVQVNEYQVTGRALFMDIVNKPFPVQLYTRDRFPAIG